VIFLKSTLDLVSMLKTLEYMFIEDRSASLDKNSSRE